MYNTFKDSSFRLVEARNQREKFPSSSQISVLVFLFALELLFTFTRNNE